LIKDKLIIETMKKTGLCLWLVCLLSVSSSAQTNERITKLTGIVSLPDMKRALLEVGTSARLPKWQWVTLAEGQRFKDIEVVRIDADRGAVEIKDQGGRVSVELAERVENAGLGICLHNAGLSHVIDLYGDIKGRSVFRHPALKSPSISIQSSARTQAEAVEVFENAFRENGLSVVLDGEKFVMIVPSPFTNTLRPRSCEIVSEPIVASSSPADEILPSGCINFAGADVWHVAMIYGHLVGRKLNATARALQGSPVVFRTVTPLSKPEAVYALETLLEFSGLKVVPIGDKEFKVAPISEQIRIE
jgi:hypothetical protein